MEAIDPASTDVGTTRARQLVYSILQVTHPPDFERLGHFYSKARKHITDKNLSIYFSQCNSLRLSDLQCAAALFIVPLNLSARDLYQRYFQLLKSMSKFSGCLQSCFAMRCVHLAVKAHTVNELYSSRIIQGLHQANQRVFQRVLLFLAAHTDQPVIEETILIGVPRADGIALYYAGMNRMIAGLFELADLEFHRAWQLSHAAKEMRAVIVPAMSLSAFLSGHSWEVFSARLPEKYIPVSGPAKEIWTLEDKIDMGSFKPMYDRFSAQIVKEHNGRIVKDLRSVSTAAPVALMRKWCGEAVIEEQRGAFRVVDGIVQFTEPNLAEQIDRELAALVVRDVQGNQ
jgi:hypothetical protein